MEKTGKAYGFFYYAGDKQAIQKELPAIRATVNTPSEMRLSLTDMDNFNARGDSELAEIAQRAKDARINYVVEADLPGNSNERTASELGDILNGVKYCLYDSSEPFRSEIFYRGGESNYVKRE
jgi:hypothetical protein